MELQNNRMPPMSPYAQPGAHLTRLGPAMRAAFQQWLAQNQQNGLRIPYDPSPYANYDMPGYFYGMTTGDPHAQNGISPYDHEMHYSDYWKMPNHPTFSNESQWAMPGPVTPRWNSRDQLIGPGGRMIADESYQ